MQIFCFVVTSCDRQNNDMHYLLIALHPHTKFQKFNLDTFQVTTGSRFSGKTEAKPMVPFGFNQSGTKAIMS